MTFAEVVSLVKCRPSQGGVFIHHHDFGEAMILGIFKRWSVLLILIVVGQRPAMPAAGVMGTGEILYLFSSPFSLGKARYKLKYCLREPLNPKQPTRSVFHRSVNNAEQPS